MKNFTKSLLFIIVLLVCSFIGFSQTEKHHEHNHRVLNEKAALEQFDATAFMEEFSKIALAKGYDLHFDQCLKNALIANQSNLLNDIFSAFIESKPKSEYSIIYKKHIEEFTNYLEVFQRNELMLRAEFKRRIQSSSDSYAKTSNPLPSPQAACTNMDFETGNLNGWTTTTSSGAGSSFVTTPGPDPFVNPINQVFAGNNSACIDVLPATGNLDWVQIEQTFLVTNSNKDFIFYTAVIIDRPGHTPCSDNAKFEVSVKDAGGAVIPCSNVALLGADAGGAACSVFNGFQTLGAYDYLNWTPIIVPLGAYVGQNVTISFRVTRCNGGGGHGARAYIEASCNPVALNASSNIVCSGSPVTLTAPNTPGYSYTWSGPGGFTGSSAVVNPTQAGAYTVTMAVTSNPSCKMVMDTVLAAAPSPTPSFNFTVTPCAPTNSVPVISTSLPGAGDPISSYTWVWGDATANGTGVSTNHTYATTGPKTIQLQVMSVGGCSATVSQSFTFSPGPVADFNVLNNCLNAATNFTSASTPTVDIVSYAWDFGDGNTGTGANVSHTYSSSGIKNVSYTVTSTSGCTNTAVKSVTINPKPLVSIGSNTVCLNLTTVFTNSSTVASPDFINTWNWDFDNNGTSDNGAQFPTNTFTTVGTHTVELKATTNNGCKDSTTIAVLVNAIQTANFTVANACLNSNVSIVNTTTVTPPDFITGYNWDFGPGATPATSTVNNPASLTYNSGGVKTITLNISSNTTCTANLVQTVQIYSQPVANFSTTSVCQSTATAYTDLSTPTGSITNWNWDFTNNGSFDNTTNAPTNIFATSGTFTTGLIVTDNNGCKDTISLPVNVWGHSIPNFTATTVCLGSSSTFSNTTNTTTNANVGGTPNWSWNFGDGSPINSLQDPTYTYTSATTYSYNAVLTATTTNGCVDNITKVVTVHVIPTPTFTPVNACLNSNVVLNNTSSIALPDNISSYIWDFGTSAAPTTTSNVQNPPLLTYNSSGVKTITLTITANTSCTATITNTVTIYPQPIANFSTTSVCQSSATAYTDLSTPTGSITNWNWDFTNNGSFDNTTNAPTNIFATSGTFTTSLIVTDNNTCKDTVKLPVDVWGHTIPNFTPDKVCFGTSSLFTNLTDDTSNPNVGVGTTYLWDFADANTSTLISPSHTYVLGGNGNATYNVTLTATSLHNCIDNAVKTVSVFAVPTASFTSNEVCLGSATSLSDASNGNGIGNFVNTFEWDFSNDGTVDVSGVSNPNFTFPNFGINAVSYTVSTSPVVGLVCKNVTNTITVMVNPNPVPDFTFVNNCINAQPNTFNGSSSTIAIGTNTAYVWAYGNGSVSAPSAASTSSVNYAGAGVYNVTLTVTSDKGCVKNVVKQVEVYAKPNMLIANSPACDQQAMTFTAVTQPSSGTIANWYWDLNNSITSIEATGQTVSNTFAGPGSQTIGVVGETNHGCKDIVIKSIYVNYVPVAVFSADTLSGCPSPEFCVNFTDASPAIPLPAHISQWQWTFGDGSNPVTNSSNLPVRHCYINNSSNQLATFDVDLVVISDSGCVSPVNHKPSYITVYPTPIASYTVSPNPGSIVEPLVYFTNQSQDYTKFWWTFVGTGPFKVDSVNVNPTHFYDDANAQIYFSNLIVANQYGCSDTAFVAIEIRPEFTFYIPNAFTPTNDDGINDYFTGAGIGIDKYEMWIFDRWGAMIFYTDDIKKGWDGRVQGKTAEGKQDVYTWKVKLRDVLGKQHQYIGHVTLLK
ncbi:MAG: PKD domain-containing protein [Bacteroidia bacterium]|nr:PKD domain-containing protein [Bacteroidia bacterium]